MKKRYSIDKSKCECGVVSFFINAAEVMGATITHKTQYDCSKICVSERVQECIWKHYSKSLGYTDEEIAELLLHYGPKATIKDDSFCFEVEDGFVTNNEEDPSRKKLRELHKELDTLLNDAPVIEDCTDEENDMYFHMANLKESILHVLDGQI